MLFQAFGKILKTLVDLLELANILTFILCMHLFSGNSRKIKRNVLDSYPMLTGSLSNKHGRKQINKIYNDVKNGNILDYIK